MSQPKRMRSPQAGLTKTSLPAVAKLLNVRRQLGLEAAAEWYSTMLRGFEALAFLERSRDMAAEPVLASVPVLPRRAPQRRG
jgi:hypothetical protein